MCVMRPTEYAVDQIGCTLMNELCGLGVLGWCLLLLFHSFWLGCLVLGVFLSVSGLGFVSTRSIVTSGDAATI
jgi:hypothetical protein